MIYILVSRHQLDPWHLWLAVFEAFLRWRIGSTGNRSWRNSALAAPLYSLDVTVAILLGTKSENTDARLIGVNLWVGGLFLGLGGFGWDDNLRLDSRTYFGKALYPEGFVRLLRHSLLILFVSAERAAAIT